MASVTKAVILAAGFGTRFLPATKAQPKEMLTVVDKPVIQYIVEEAVAAGIRDLIIITGQSKRAIEDHFDRNFELETRLREQGKLSTLKEVQRITKLANFIYVRQKEARGDGHALLEAESLVAGGPFAIMFGDNIVDSRTPLLRSTINVYEEFNAPVVSVKPVRRRDVSRYGIVGGIRLRPDLYQVTRVVEKPRPERAPSTLAVIDRYVLTPEFFAVLKRTPRRRGQELRTIDAMPRFLKRHPVYAYVTHGTWHDCGSKLGLLKATVAYGLRHPEVKSDFKRFLRAVV